MDFSIQRAGFTDDDAGTGHILWGNGQEKNVLATVYYSFAAAIIVSILWVLGQYSLAFGNDVAGIFGNLDKALFNGVGINSVYPGQTIPENVFAVYQLMFAIITVALISGAVVERLSFGAWIVFVTIWSILIYSPLAHWVWGGGWMSKLGALFGQPNLGTMDFAGGLVVHISSGISALVCVLYLGPRVNYEKDTILPNSILTTFIGAGLLWFGWFGFNAGSALQSNGLAGNAFLVTNTAAAFGALVWIVIEWIRNKKPSIIGGTSGLVAGLATITPASGYVDVLGAIIIGTLAGLCTYMFVALIKKALKYDDSLDAFGIHGVSGTLGILLTGFLANPAICGKAGLFYGGTGGIQLLIQTLSALIGIVFSAVGTILILLLIEKVFGLKMRVEKHHEIGGLDVAMHGEREE